MIYLGLANNEKQAMVAEYVRERGIKKAFMLTPAKFAIECPVVEIIEYSSIIMYKTFYRLLQEIDGSTLVVINECLRTQNRNDLTYNCIRHFLAQTSHQLIFQYLPIIDGFNDFLSLVDFDTHSRWKRETNQTIIEEASIVCAEVAPIFNRVDIGVSDSEISSYENEKAKLIKNIGLKDPHTIPRNLYLISGKAKLQHIRSDRWYIGRNNRFKLSSFQTFRENKYPNAPYAVFEVCHNFIDFSDFLFLSGQSIFDFLVAGLKIDEWYFQRCLKWIEELKRVYSAIRQYQKRS